MWVCHCELQERCFTLEVISDLEFIIKKKRLQVVDGTEASINDNSGQVRAKCGYLGGIFGRFGALRGARGVTDG